MAKATYTRWTMEDYLSSFYPGHFTLERESSEKATLLDDESGNPIVLKGKNLKLEGDELTGGTVHKVTFTNFLGDPYATVDGEFSARKLSDAADKGIDKLLEMLFSGNDLIKDTGNANNPLLGYAGRDVIKAGSGEDLLDGGGGNGDQLFGGDGDDVFRFRQGNGHDVVRDFEAGANLQSDIVMINTSYVVKKNADGDAVIMIDKNDTLTLEGVAKADLESHHIWFG